MKFVASLFFDQVRKQLYAQVSPSLIRRLIDDIFADHFQLILETPAGAKSTNRIRDRILSAGEIDGNIVTRNGIFYFAPVRLISLQPVNVQKYIGGPRGMDIEIEVQKNKTVKCVGVFNRSRFNWEYLPQIAQLRIMLVELKYSQESIQKECVATNRLISY